MLQTIGKLEVERENKARKDIMNLLLRSTSRLYHASSDSIVIAPQSM